MVVTMSKTAKELAQIQSIVEEIVKSTMQTLFATESITLPSVKAIEEAPDLQSAEEEAKTVLITPKEAMKILGIAWNCMYQDLLKRKDFPCFKIGAKYFINRELLQEWANKQCSRR